MKIVEGSHVFLVVYYDPEDDMTICQAYADRNKAKADARARNKDMFDTSCFDENGDFDYDNHDSADWAFYDVVEMSIIL